MAGGDTSDGGLVHRARLGDRDAFATLVERHLEGLHDHVARITGDPHTPLTLGTFREALRRLGSLQEPRRFRTWLYALAGEQLAGAARRSHRPPPGLTSEQRAIWRAVEKLPLDRARALDLISRRGVPPGEADLALRGDADRAYRSAARSLNRVIPDGVGVFASLPPYRPPATEVVLGALLASWGTLPPPPPPPVRRSVMSWVVGGGVALLLAAGVPAAAVLLPERTPDIAPAEYQAVPWIEATGTPSPPPAEPDTEVLPPLPSFTPEPPPSDSETTGTEGPSEDAGGEASPTPGPEPSESPGTGDPTEEPSECAVPLGPLCPSESPSDGPSPQPGDTATSSPSESPSPEPTTGQGGGEQASDDGTAGDEGAAPPTAGEDAPAEP